MQISPGVRLGQEVDISPDPESKGVVVALSCGADGSVLVKIEHTQWIELRGNDGEVE